MIHTLAKTRQRKFHRMIKYRELINEGLGAMKKPIKLPEGETY